LPEISLIVRMKAKPGRGQDLEAALRAVVEPTHREPGCMRFALHRSMTDAATYVLVERWSSKQALESHLAQPYLRTLLGQLAQLAEPADVAEYELLMAGDPEKLL
jgi:quinol monooxygenase YgiN